VFAQMKRSSGGSGSGKEHPIVYVIGFVSLLFFYGMLLLGGYVLSKLPPEERPCFTPLRSRCVEMRKTHENP
jgi:hypothetical protein